MRKFLYTYITLALGILTGCQKMEFENIVNDNNSQADETVEIIASVEEGTTRTQLSGNSVIWEKNDMLNVFYGYTASSKFTLKSGIGKTNATFRCPQLNKNGEKIDHWVSIYPYDEEARVSYSTETQSYTVKTEFPAIQKYCKGSFGSGASPMMAVTKEGDISFKNVGAAIKLRIKSAVDNAIVTKIEATTTTGRRLAGEAYYTLGNKESDVPSVTLTENAVDKITLDCGSGVKLVSSEVAEFIFSLPPMIDDNRFQENELLFHVYIKDRERFTITKQKAFECKRSQVTTIGEDGYLYNPNGDDIPESPNVPEEPNDPNIPDEPEDSADMGVGNTPSKPDAPRLRDSQDFLW